MRLEAFRELAARMWEDIPDALKVGVEGLVVEEERVDHPHLEGIYTLGECFTEDWPSQYGGPGDTRSVLLIYHGSFRQLASEDPSFDWEGELWETILHELLHHREFAAGQAGLEDVDWAVEQNQRRLMGHPYDPGFYRMVPPGPDGAVRLESEIFVETEVEPDEEEATFTWRDRTYSVRVGLEERPAFIQVTNLARGRLWVAVRERRPWWRRIFGVPPAEMPAEVRRRALPRPGAGEGA